MTIRWTEEQLAAHLGQTKPRTAPAPSKQATPKPRSDAPPDIEGALVVELQRAGLAGYQRNYRFDPRRRSELDFAWVAQKVAIEVQGGIHSYGAHVRPEGYRRDAEKTRRAQLMGWIVLPCLAADVRDGSIVADVETALELRRA